MKRILCIGDSNTFGHDPRSRTGERYGEDQRWTCLLRREDREILNWGRNGKCICRETEFAALGERLRAAGAVDAVTVMLGTNDLLRGADAGEAAARMEKLLRFLAENVMDARLILIAPPPMAPGAWVPTRELIRQSRRMTEAYRDLADALGLVFADAGEWGVEPAFDGVHFTAEGHAAFARGLSALLDGSPSEKEAGT